MAAPVEAVGSGSALVFAPTDLGEPGPETRLDGRFGARAEATAFDQWAWPVANRPSLDRSRRLILPSTVGTQIYFRESRTDWQRATTVEGQVWRTP